jgi:predicted negative regulator of RcsB-dependent stress response
MALDIKDNNDLNDKFSEFFLKNKKNIFLFFLIFLILYFSTIFYMGQVEKKQFIASDMYQKIQLLKDLNDVEKITEELKDNYSNTVYAARASLFLGNLYAKEKNFTKAEENYLWSSKNAIEPTIKSLAHFQLSVIFYTIKNYDSSLKEAIAIEESGFKGLKYYLLGDIYIKLNKKNEALESYEKAYTFYSGKNDLAKVIKTKIDVLGQK